MRFKKPLRRGLASRWLQRTWTSTPSRRASSKFTLFESELKPSGAEYSERGIYDLKRAPA